MDELHHYSHDINTLPIDAELEVPLSILSEQEQGEVFSRRDERALAFHFLYAAEQFDYEDSLESITATFRSEFDLTFADDSYAVTLARAVIDGREELDKQIIPFLKNWRLDRLGCCTRLILRLAVWELSQKDAIPSVIINEAIELAKGFAEKDAYKFINGILDEVVKSKDSSENAQ